MADDRQFDGKDPSEEEPRPKVNTFNVPITRPSDGLRFEVPVQASSPEQAAQLINQAINSGTLDLDQFGEAERRFIIQDPEGRQVLNLPAEPDGTPRMEFFGGAFGVSLNPMQEFGRQFASAGKGFNNLLFNTTTFAIDAANAVTQAGAAVFGDGEPTEIEGVLNKWRSNVRAKQAQANAAANEQMIAEIGANPSVFGEIVGETLPFFALPATLSTYTRTVAYNTALGALAGGIFDQSAQNFGERLDDMTVGAAFGLGASALFNVKSGFQSYASRRFLRKFDEDLARANLELEREVQGITGDVDFNFSMGQITGDPFITGLEFGAADRLQRAAQNRRIETLVNFFQRRADALTKTGNPEQIAIDLNQTMKTLSQETRLAAGTYYSRGVDNLIEEFGDEIVLDARGYLDKAREIAGELADPRHLGAGARVPEGLRAHINFLDQSINPFRSARRTFTDADGKSRVAYDVVDKRSGEIIETFTGRGANLRALSKVELDNLEQGGLSVDDLAEVLKGNRRLAAGEQPLFENMTLGSAQNVAAALKGSLLESMEGSSSAAISRLQDIRGTYAQEMQKLNRIRNTVLGKVFGDEKAVFDADIALDKMLNRTAQQNNATREILETWAPDLLDDIKGVALRRAVENSINPAQRQSLSLFDPVKLANNLAGREGLPGTMGRGLFNAAEQQDIIKTAEAIRTLQETHIPFFERASAQQIQDTAINVISRSPEFMARWGARLLGTGRNLEFLLNDAGARTHIQNLAKAGPDSELGRMAIVYLSIVGGEGEAQAQRDEEEAQRQSLRQRAVQRGVVNP